MPEKIRPEAICPVCDKTITQGQSRVMTYVEGNVRTVHRLCKGDISRVFAHEHRT